MQGNEHLALHCVVVVRTAGARAMCFSQRECLNRNVADAMQANWYSALQQHGLLGGMAFMKSN